MKRSAWGVLAVVGVIAAAQGCGDDSDGTGAGASDAASSTASSSTASSSSSGGHEDPGGLIEMKMEGRVGVLLDDIPAGDAREQAATDALAQGDDFWKTRAEAQIRLMNYRLAFRGPAPLPLPSKTIWKIDLTQASARAVVDGHDYVLVPYTFSTHILTDAASPAAASKKLAVTGGTTDEVFVLPLDPEMLLERTGYACMDEDEYPIGSVFEENTFYFYDDSCTVAPPDCHLTEMPLEDCVDAIDAHVGRADSTLHFTRVAWDAGLADSVRVGEITNETGADLAVVPEDIADESRIIYRFFEDGACELGEGVIAKLGWRRLLTFSATVQNNGTVGVDMGDVTDPNNPWVKSHVFEFSQCHNHYHFSHYGDFEFAGAPGSKRAFCLEDTSRFHNDERTTLRAKHQTCQQQGITPGWGDEYEFGIPGQWVDITDVTATGPQALTFNSNPDHFLCEGKPVLDADGQPIFEPTDFKDAKGETVSRMKCDLPANWHDDNLGSHMIDQPTGSYVTQPCTRGQNGPLRSCGLRESAPVACNAGDAITLSCVAAGAPAVLRVCEVSEALGVGVACTVGDSVHNVIVDITPTDVTFACPAQRDAAVATNGAYALYDGALAPSQTATVTCTPH